MVLTEPRRLLRLTELQMPKPGVGQVLVRVAACAVCRTDLHVVDGELPNPKLLLVPGHEIIGRIAEVGAGVDRFKPGDRVGIPWVPSFPYELLWQERMICSVANLTRKDGEEFLALAPRVPVRTEIETFPLAEANEALARLRTGRLRGAAVLVMIDAG
jgi:D-arabinose 1-dehydrogenase-like Zn-dependent alcohol dehydrogenase